MISVTKEIHFCYGHRLLDYKGACSQPHGHNALLRVTYRVRGLDAQGMAVDFHTIRDTVKAWVDKHWDHGFLLNDRDVELLRALETVAGAKLYLFHAQNPTAEVMARHLAEQVPGIDLPGSGAVLSRVELYETPSACAVWEL